ncbi:MAG: hypothetical protein H6815_05190 [Phycisphaeraceae bacterium]|nr:hypothetical protein [Phycisphaerales bacterium]MCB9859831.1 hypothetical protein [Phycisphaeraceae bacterium]
MAKKRTTKSGTTAKKTTGRKRGRPAGSKNKKTSTAGGLRGISTQALYDELYRRSHILAERRDELLAELDMIDAEMASLGASSSQPTRRSATRASTKRVSTGGKRASTKKRRGGGRRKGKGGSTLEDSLVAVLTGKTMGVTEVADAVLKAGYKSDSPNFRTIVNQCLTKSDRIKKIARGQYTAA